MIDDPIVAEMRRIREQHAASHGNDLTRICADVRAAERKSARKLVHRQPKPAPASAVR